MTQLDKFKIMKTIDAHLHGGYRILPGNRKSWALTDLDSYCDIQWFNSIDEVLGLNRLSCRGLWRYSIFECADESKFRTIAQNNFARRNIWLRPFKDCSSIEELVLKLSVLGYWK